MSELKATAAAVAKEKWGDKTKALMEGGKIRMPFRNEPAYAGWSIESDLVDLQPDRCCIKAMIRDADGRIRATGHAHEDRTSSMINKTSYVENCETSAIGRALANVGYAGSDASKRPSREEMQKVVRYEGDMNRATIDEQMMTGIYPALKAPAGDSYGVAEQVVNDLAAQYRVKPGNFQDVTWKGLKGVPGMPMMEHINQSIERTARITNQTPQEVLDAFIRKRAPMYSAAPFGLLGLTPEEDQ